MTDYELDQETIINAERANALVARPLVEWSVEDHEFYYEFLIRTSSFSNYMIKMLKDNQENWMQDGMIDSEGVKRPAYGYLYHSNSVKTAFDYIQRKALYSRSRGEGGIQTEQWSDDLDERIGIYNDIFFECKDIPHVYGTNTSAYGPVMFVFDADILHEQNVRIFKHNPVDYRNRIEEVKYHDLFYQDIREIREEINMDSDNNGKYKFVRDLGHHITIFNTEEVPFENHLKFIYIEKYDATSGRERQLAQRIRHELDANGLNGVQVAIRSELPTRKDIYANSREELWSIPKNV